MLSSKTMWKCLRVGSLNAYKNNVKLNWLSKWHKRKRCPSTVLLQRNISPVILNQIKDIKKQWNNRRKTGPIRVMTDDMLASTCRTTYTPIQMVVNEAWTHLKACTRLRSANSWSSTNAWRTLILNSSLQKRKGTSRSFFTRYTFEKEAEKNRLAR